MLLVDPFYVKVRVLFFSPVSISQSSSNAAPIQHLGIVIHIIKWCGGTWTWGPQRRRGQDKVVRTRLYVSVKWF
jgi:hypothetical protein